MSERKKKTMKKKIYRKTNGKKDLKLKVIETVTYFVFFVSDYYTEKDLYEPKIPFNSVTINDFNAHGEIIKPKAPCVATNIDPEYFSDATIRLPVRKFLVKTDTMKIQKIMRTKFFMYTNQQRAIEKTKEYEKHKQIYDNVMSFYQVGNCFKII